MQVVNGGLQPGDRVVAAAAQTLIAPGSRVQAVEAATQPATAKP